jgi:hypothetical protein
LDYFSSEVYLKCNFMKKFYFYEPLSMHEFFSMEYESRLTQYFYRIDFYESHIQTHEKTL